MMITPHQLQHEGVTRQRQRAVLERACDDAIVEADHRDHWPARVRYLRVPISAQIVREIADSYAAVGWGVEPFPESQDCYMIIHRPVRCPIAPKEP